MQPGSVMLDITGAEDGIAAWIAIATVPPVMFGFGTTSFVTTATVRAMTVLFAAT